MARLIDADAIKYITSGCGGWGIPENVVSDYEIAKMPTIDAVEVVHGRWTAFKNTAVRCSECKLILSDICGECFSYCPNCGAKMDGDGNGT